MTHQPTAPDGHELMLRVVPMPADLNGNGDVFGGWVMAQVDIAGGITAFKRARGRVATVAVNSFLFKQPVSVGDVLSFYATIVRVGRTSITVDVEVFAERNPAQPIIVKVTEATLTYVALYADGRKRCVHEHSHWRRRTHRGRAGRGHKRVTVWIARPRIKRRQAKSGSSFHRKTLLTRQVKYNCKEMQSSIQVFMTQPSQVPRCTV
jgi:acyl-CoA thioesterase YciA